MQRYQIGPYQSVYRDQGSVKVNETLRQRFVENFAADDMLAGAVDQMQAADFAGDQALKKDLENRTRESLEARAARGDFESMGMDVLKSARNFQRDYSPIQQNLQKYNAYKQSLEEARNKKIGEGGISEETYQRALQKSRHNYEGLQLNEDGTLDETSTFNGFNFVGDVDISKLMDEAMKSYKPHEGGQEITEVAQPVPGKPGLYQVKRGDRYEIVPQKDVDKIFNDVISDPNVQAALNQQAELRTFDMTDEDIQQNLLTQLNGDPDDPDSNGLIGARDAAVAAGKEEEAAAYQSLIDRNNELLNGTGVETAEEMADLRRNFAKQSVKTQELQREQGAARAKFIRENIFTTYEEDYDALWLAGQKAEMEAYLPTVLTDTGVSEINNPGGATVGDITKYAQKMANQEVSIMQDVSNTLGNLTNLQGQPLSADDIINGNYSAEVKKSAGSMLDRFEQQLIHVRTQQAIQNTRLENAKQASGYTGQIDKFTQGKSLGIPNSEILNYAREYYKNPNMTMEDLNRTLRGELDRDRVQTTMGTYGGATKLSDNAVAFGNFITSKQNPQNVSGEDLITSFRGAQKKAFKSAKRALNAELAKTARLNAASMASSNAPGANNRESKANTKAMKDTFVGKPMDQNFKIYYGGTVDETAGGGASTIGTFMKENNMSQVPTVKNIRYPVTAIGGLQTVVFTVQGKDNEGNAVSKDILVPASNFRQSGMDQMFASPLYRMDQELDMHRVAGSLNPTIEFRDDKGNLTGGIRYSLREEGKGNDVAYVLDSNGEVMYTYSTDDPEFQDIIKDNAALGQSFRTKLN